MDIVDEQIDVVTRAFLATTVGCARCHDHKFDPIPTTDYYALAGIFRSTERSRASSAARRRECKNDYSGELMALAAPTSASNGDAKQAPAAKLSDEDQAEVRQDRSSDLSNVAKTLESISEIGEGVGCE